FKELGRQCLRIGLSLLVTLLFGISGALAATTSTNSNTLTTMMIINTKAVFGMVELEPVPTITRARVA
ncbi:hypothetical protein, partial [Secundilactobacillus kimchicus]